MPMGEIHIRLAVPPDCGHLSHLRETLWPESSAAEHKKEIASILAGEYSGAMPMVILVAEAPGEGVAGFLEVGLRSHADGCDPKHPVGFVEGWFVAEGYSRKGVGTRLLMAAEDWARHQGCTEMASDTWIDQPVSQRVHEALKFEVVDRYVHYRKAL
jgi:aminoglycoside 6'-N-acetyltransferase I